MTKNFQDYLISKQRPAGGDAAYMEMAIKAAEHARANGDAPFGAVLVFPGGHMVDNDTTLSDRDQTCHAEMNVLRKAARTKLRRFDDCVLYSTSEPCPMCLYAAKLAGVREVFFGTPTGGGIHVDGMVIKGGVLAEQCAKLARPLSTKES